MPCKNGVQYDRPTDLLNIGIIGNLHDVDLKAFSDIPDTAVNSISAVVGLDKFIPSFAVSDVSLF